MFEIKRHGWNLINVHKLRDELIKSGGKNAKEQVVVNKVRDWWNLPEQVEARSLNVSTEDSKINAAKLALIIDNGFRGKIINKAKTEIYAWKALKEWSYELLMDGQVVPPDALAILLRPEGPPCKNAGRPKGRKQSDFNTSQQIFAVILTLKAQTRFGSLGTNSHNGAFEVISRATGLDYEVVREHWKCKHR